MDTRPASIINKEHIPAREEEIGERKFPCNVTISVHADSACGACAPAIEHVRHIEERNKWGNIPLDTSRCVHGLELASILLSYCYEPPERDKRIDHVQSNDHFLIQIASNRVTPITTFVAVKRHSCISANSKPRSS